jgi:hypothetical protein
LITKFAVDFGARNTTHIVINKSRKKERKEERKKERKKQRKKQTKKETNKERKSGSMAELANASVVHSRFGIKSQHRQKIFSYSVFVTFEFKSVGC